MSRSTVCLVAAWLVASGLRPSEASEGAVRFRDQVAPILVARCLACHGPEKASAHFRVDTYARLMTESDAGRNFEPGRPDDSLFFALVVLNEPTGRMPKNGEMLPKAEVEILRGWIEQGAGRGDVAPTADLAQVVRDNQTRPNRDPRRNAMNDLALATTRFALDLQARNRNQPGNWLISPFSIATALAMTSAGARGPTASEMLATLHLAVGSDGHHAAFADLLTRIVDKKKDETDRLEIANALWGQAGLSYRPEFLKLVESRYGAGLHPINFAGDPSTARLTINTWVADRTNDKIKDLLGPNDLDRSTDLILTNAIYFRGTWTRPFPKTATKPGPFQTAHHGPMVVPMMHQTETLGYFDGDGIQALELPYAGGNLAMVVLLPAVSSSLADLDESLTAANLVNWISKLAPRRVEVTLPRFRIGSRFELAKALQALGMVKAFGPEADFSGLTTDRRLAIKDVIHQAFADIHEEGTEAAAASAVTMLRSQAMPARPTVFRADRPFLFLIRDIPTGTILFLGRFEKPEV